MAKDTKAQVEHAQKEIKANAPWIEVVKKQKGTSMDRMEMMNATLEEEAKRKARVLHVRVVGWAEKGSPQEDATNLGTKIGASNIPFASAWRVGRDESRAKALIIRFMDIDKKKAFLSKRKALKGEKIYLDDDLTPAQVAHRKENMPRVLDARDPFLVIAACISVPLLIAPTFPQTFIVKTKVTISGKRPSNCISSKHFSAHSLSPDSIYPEIKAFHDITSRICI